MVSIIIPTLSLKKKIIPKLFYKKRFSLINTINSIVKNVKIEYELILIVNDINNKELFNYVKSNNKIKKYILLSTNVGVARAWNMGANIAEGDHLCFCNDDVEVGEGALEKLIEVLNEDDSVGEVGPNGGEWNGITSGKRVGIDKIEEADEISGFFFVIKSKVYEEVGGFDNYYTPAGCEEIDMSFKIRAKGYKCLVIPHIAITHFGHHGISSRNTEIKYFDKKINTAELDKRNKEYFYSKWYSKTRNEKKSNNYE